MIIENQKVKLKWNKYNKKKYESKGYTFTCYGDMFEVDINDLPLRAKVNVKVECDYCNKVVDILYQNYNVSSSKKQGKYACNECKQNAIVKSTLERRQKALFEKCQNACKKHDYKMLTTQNDIKNNTTYINYLCPSHGIQSIRISNLINGRTCPKCAKEICKEKYKINPNEVEKRIQECGGELLNKHEYENRWTKNLRVLCPMCKDEFVTSLVIFTQHGGKLCDNCSRIKSVGEHKIKQYLQSNNIQFLQQKSFEECRDKNPLRFDFYLPDYNTCIEYNGEQHYKAVDFGNYGHELASLKLSIQQEHDKIKCTYCVTNGIKLLEIKYNEDVNQILEDFLNNTKLI